MDHDRTLNGSEKLALKDWLITRAQNYASSLKPLADAVPLNIDNIDFSAVLGKVKPTGYETLIGPSLLSYSDSRASILNQYNDGVQSFVSRQAMMSAGRTTIAVENTSEMQQQNRFRAMDRDMNANYISGLGLTFGQQMYFNARNNGGNEQQVNNAYLRGTIIDASIGIAGGAASAGASASVSGVRGSNYVRPPSQSYVYQRGSVNYAAERGVVAPIHKNSLNYVGDTHVYAIRGPDGSLLKVGESAQGIRVGDGLSIRAEQQVRALQRETGQRYTSEIRQNFGGKSDARAYETQYIQTYERLFGKRPPGNPLDR